MREVSWQALVYNVKYYIQSKVKQDIQEKEDEDDLLIPEKTSGMAIGTYERTAKVLGRTSCVFTNVRAIEGAKFQSGIGNRQIEWFADIKQYKFYYFEKDNIINRSANRAFAQYPPIKRLPQSVIDLTKSFIKKESDSLAGSSDSMSVNKDGSYNAEVNRNSFELPSSNYNESDELDRMKVYVAPTYDGLTRRAGKKSKGTLKKKKKNNKKKKKKK